MQRHMHANRRRACKTWSLGHRGSVAGDSRRRGTARLRGRAGFPFGFQPLVIDALCMTYRSCTPPPPNYLPQPLDTRTLSNSHPSDKMQRRTPAKLRVWPASPQRFRSSSLLACYALGKGFRLGLRTTRGGGGSTCPQIPFRLGSHEVHSSKYS